MAPDIILAKAEFNAFLRQYTVYKVLKNNNRFNIGSESIRLSLVDDMDFCRFIYYKEKRAGGVILRNSTIKHLFLVPGFEDVMTDIIRFLHDKAAEKAEPEKGIACLPSDSLQAASFGKLGYETIRKMRCMIKPLRGISWRTPTGYKFRKPDVSDSLLLSELFYAANIDEPWHQPVTMELFSRGIGMYFNTGTTTAMTEASSICIDDKTGKAVGACLVSMDEGYPFIFDIHVLKEHRRRGIASGMLKKAINRTAAKHDFMRLFVIDGNPAARMYENFGFISGNPVFIMRYSIR